MAQKGGAPGLGARLRRMARRYGFTGGKAATTLLVAVLALLGVAGALLSGRSAGVEITRVPVADQPADGDSSLAGEAGEGAAETPPVVVHVDGAVAAPGVYELAVDARVNDAVAAAGGLLSEADTSTINLAASAAPTLVNINTATSEELQRLSGVGEATAAAIIEDRQANGPFSSPEDLMRVSGIGEKKFAKIKAHICV